MTTFEGKNSFKKNLKTYMFNSRIAHDAHEWQQNGGAPPAGSHVSTAPTKSDKPVSKNRRKKMKQKAKKQAQMLKKVAEQMDEQDEELKKRLVRTIRVRTNRL